MFRALLLAMVLGAAAPALARAEAVSTAHVRSEFISDAAAIAPGAHFTVALVQTIAPGWHTYWRNPGDSGDPTEIDWRLPPGFSAGEMRWPAPERMPLSFLMNYGYAGEVVYPIAFTAPADLAVGRPVTLTGKLSWLVCSDICIPEQTTVSLTLPVEAQARANGASAARIANARVPGLLHAEAHISAGDPGVLSVGVGSVAARMRDLYFFPYPRNVIDHAASQTPRVGPNGISFSLKPGAARNLGQAPLQGVMTFDLRDANGVWSHQAFELTAAPGAPLPGTSDAPAQGKGGASEASAPTAVNDNIESILVAAALAFLGGLFLNIMPCVLPVLSIKALAFAGGGEAKSARQQGILYLVGVFATFLALAALLLALRSMGEAVGWGFQLQSPWVSASLALLFFLIGLNLLGVFSVGARFQNVGHELTRSGKAWSALFTGVLAVVAATPCTAPFMAGAIGVALTQSTPIALFVFAALALGFALPLTALSFAPALQRLLPKPGAWMERAKVVLAFPMFATAVWLSSVLSAQAGASAAAALLMLAAALAFAFVVGQWGRVWIGVGVLAVLIAGAFAVAPLNAPRVAATATAESWSPARVASLRAEGKAVLVNFTAAWCVTCQVNEIGVLRSPRVVASFRDHGVTYLEADWTNPNPDIAAALAAQGRAGVPLYLYYPAGGGAPIVMPQILSEDIVLRAVGDASR